MELAHAFPGGIASTGRRLSLAGKAAEGVDGAAAGNDVCGSGDAYGLRRRITFSAIGPECPGDIDRYGERHVGIDPAVRHSNIDGELEQNREIADGVERWRRKSGRRQMGSQDGVARQTVSWTVTRRDVTHDGLSAQVNVPSGH
jgi:hypothetical protein